MEDFLLCWYALGWVNVAMWHRPDDGSVRRYPVTPTSFVLMMVMAPLLFLSIFLFWIMGGSRDLPRE